VRRGGVHLVPLSAAFHRTLLIQLALRRSDPPAAQCPAPPPRQRAAKLEQTTQRVRTWRTAIDLALKQHSSPLSPFLQFGVIGGADTPPPSAASRPLACGCCPCARPRPRTAGSSRGARRPCRRILPMACCASPSSSSNGGRSAWASESSLNAIVSPFRRAFGPAPFQNAQRLRARLVAHHPPWALQLHAPTCG